MEGSALLFMLLSWGLILGLNLYCFIMLFTRQPQEIEKKEAVRKKEEFEEEEIT